MFCFGKMKNVLNQKRRIKIRRRRIVCSPKYNYKKGIIKVKNSETEKEKARGHREEEQQQQQSSPQELKIISLTFHSQFQFYYFFFFFFCFQILFFHPLPRFSISAAGYAGYAGSFTLLHELENVVQNRHCVEQEEDWCGSGLPECVRFNAD